MTDTGTARSMVRTLRRRVLVVVAVAIVLVGVASVWGLRLVTERNSERQVQVAAQSVTMWGAEDRGDRVIDSARLAAVDAASTFVALLDAHGQVIATTSSPSVAVSELESIAATLGDGRATRSDIGPQTILFTEVTLPDSTVFDDGTRTPVTGALVGIGVEGSDRLVTALALAALGILTAVLLAVAGVVTLVVSRTTKSLTELAETVERGELRALAHIPAAEFAETRGLSVAISRLDERRNATERQLRDFVADASHELRTPLTKIQGWAELHFQRPNDAATTDRAFERIVDDAETMRSLVDRLTQLARADAAPSITERVDLASICRAAVEDAALLDPAATPRLHAPSAAIVDGDPVALTQLVRNLVGNALVHAGPDATVAVAITVADDRVELVVEDDGVGIPASVRDRAFERFVTGDRRTGTGLGLAIVQAVALAHDGTVALDSSPGTGTRVTVRLPAVTA